jgi:tetratricopeptide (TPR) repeat protein
MTEHWQRVTSLFDEARELDAANRAELLQRRCGDSDTRDDVLALLQSHDALRGRHDSGFLRHLNPVAVMGLLDADAEDEDEVVGSRIGRYRVERRIGSGGMGVVYSAHDPRLDRTVALKLLPRHLGLDEDARRRFENEARAASALDHPAIVTVYEIGDAPDGRLFIAMTYCEGRTLRDLLSTGPLPVAQVISLTRQIAEGLAAAHRRGIVHRDVKPHNIIITPDGVVKIVDFGIAGAAGAPAADAAATPGTVAYMSPEQTRGAAVDARSDIWSLGVVMHEMLTGCHPFAAADDHELIAAIRSAPLSPISAARTDAPDGLCRIIERCLAKESAARFGSAAAVLRSIQALERQLHPGAPVRRPGAWLFAALAGVTTLLALSLFAARAGSRGPSLEPSRVAVAVFDDHTGSAAAGEIAAMAGEWLTHGLFQTGIIEVVPLAAYRAEAADGMSAHALARSAGARLLLAGGAYGGPDGIRLAARITDVADGTVIEAIDPIEANVAAPLDAVEELRRRVQSALNTRLDTVMTHLRAVERPPRLEAYREYLAGRDAHAGRDLPRALAHFRRAAELDSTFMLPRVIAAVVMNMMGNLAGAEEEVIRLEAARERLDPFSRAHVDWLRAGIDGDREGMYSAMREAARLAPGSTLVTYQYADEAVRVGRTREATDVLTSITPERGELRGWIGYWQVLGAALHLQGRHTRELNEIRRARRLYPTDPRAAFLEVQALAARGRVTDIHAIIDSVSRTPWRGEPSAGAMMLHAALEMRAHTRRRSVRAAADSLLLRAVAWYRSVPSEQHSARTRFELVIALAALDRRSEAASVLGPLLAAPPGSPGPSPFASRASPYYPDRVAFLGMQGVLAARGGEREAAQAALAGLATLDHPRTRGRRDFWRAAIALATGDRAAGSTLLEESFGRGLPHSLNVHNSLELEPLRRTRRFSNLLSGSP